MQVKMNGKEQQAYVEKLRSPEFKLESSDPLEVEAFAKARAAYDRIMRLQAEAREVERQIKQLDDSLGARMRESDAVNGELSAYTRLLILAEDGRLSVAATRTHDEDIRKRAEADAADQVPSADGDGAEDNVRELPGVQVQEA